MKSLHGLAVAAIVSLAPLHNAVARDLVERFAAAGVDPTLAPGAPGLFTDAGLAFKTEASIAKTDAAAAADLASDPKDLEEHQLLLDLAAVVERTCPWPLVAPGSPI